MLFRIKLFDFCTFNIKPYTFLLINILQIGNCRETNIWLALQSLAW